jgi:hypothetical protein
MFIKPYNFVLFTSHTRDLENFSVVSVLAFILPTPGGGVVKVTKDHKKISCLMGPYNTVTRNHYIYNHGANQHRVPQPWQRSSGQICRDVIGNWNHQRT